MERSRTIENMEIGNGTVPNNGKNEIREWNDPAHWKKWDTGIEQSRTMEKMGYGNRAVPKNGKNRIREWNGPKQ